MKKRILKIFGEELGFPQTKAFTWYPERGQVKAVGYMHSETTVVTVSDLASGKVLSRNEKFYFGEDANTPVNDRVIPLNLELSSNALHFTVGKTVNPKDGRSFLPKYIYLIVEEHE